jgi:hypothetical protein
LEISVLSVFDPVLLFRGVSLAVLLLPLTFNILLSRRNVIRPGATTLDEVCQRRTATAGDNIHPTSAFLVAGSVKQPVFGYHFWLRLCYNTVAATT